MFALQLDVARREEIIQRQNEAIKTLEVSMHFLLYLRKTTKMEMARLCRATLGI